MERRFSKQKICPLLFHLFAILLLIVAPMEESSAASADKYEDDDSYGQAKAIDLNSQVAGHKTIPGYEWKQVHNFHDHGDEDWVKYYAHARDNYYKLEVFDVGANCDPVIEIYDADDMTVPIVGPIDDFLAGGREYAEWDCQKDGLYYFRIRPYEPSGYGDGTAYSITLTIPRGSFPGFVYGSVTPNVMTIVTTDGHGEAANFSSGMYYMPHPAGTFNLAATASGYQVYTDSIIIGPMGYLVKNIQLQALEDVEAAFSASPTSGTAPLTVQFTDASTGNPGSWSWNFGDGGASSLRNPGHTYTAAGTYTVSLTATGAGGSDTEAKTDLITVNEPVEAAFSASPTSGTAPLTVQFTDASTGDPGSWSWSFGDGGASSLRNPDHTYTAAGTYTVSLTATGAGGSDTETKTGLISVNEPVEDVVAAFSASPASGTAPLTVQFTDASTGDPVSWSWSFGDGGASSLRNPDHTYTAAGTYTVSLTATGAGGSDTEAKTDLITVNEPVEAAFSASPTSGTAPLTVQFTDASTGDPVSWSWSFGDGGASSLRNPDHTYTAAGTYTVSLTATGAGGSDTETKTGLITVGEPAEGVEAAFSASPASGTAPLTVQFTDASTGDPGSWSWSFGDGGASSLRNPGHTYTAAGTYTVSLTATGAGGSDTETKTGLITVGEPAEGVEAAFIASPTSGTAPLTVQFTDASTGDPGSWSWSFGDGGASSLRNPGHTYTAAGTYTVSLTATGAGGSDTETKTGLITVGESAEGVEAAFSASPISGTAPLTVQFTDASTGDPGSWSWSFGDGGASSLRNPGHTYTAAGTYTVSLTATGAGGSDTETKTGLITVGEPAEGVEAAFSASPASGTAPLTVQFNGRLHGGPWFLELELRRRGRKLPSEPRPYLHRSGNLYGEPDGDGCRRVGYGDENGPDHGRRTGRRGRSGFHRQPRFWHGALDRAVQGRLHRRSGNLELELRRRGNKFPSESNPYLQRNGQLHGEPDYRRRWRFGHKKHDELDHRDYADR